MNLKINYGIIFILFLLPFSASAISEADVIRINHCDMENPTVGIIYAQTTAYNCGKLLVGAANVYPNAIQWIGDETGSVYVNSELNDFGFTGSEKTYDGTDDYLWYLDTATRFILNEANPVSFTKPAPAIGFFYAPYKVGYNEGSIEYTVAKLGKINKIFAGEGIDDNEQNAAITLKVEASSSNAAIQQVSCGEGCQEITIPINGKITFDVTPDINQNIVKELDLNSDLHNNVLVRLIASEKNTGCSSTSFAFEDRGMKTTKALSTNKNDYYDFLSIAGPDAMLPNCERYYSFLRSPGKSFEFYANNKKNTNEGYIEYVFFIEGHYIPFDKQKWAGISHQTFRIRTTNKVITKQTPVARITATPLKGEVPLKINLDASSSSDSDGNIISYEWSSNDNPFSSKEVSPIHTFSQVGTYIIILKVTDNTGLTNVTQKEITVSPSTINDLPSLGNAIPMQVIDGALKLEQSNQDINFNGGIKIDNKLAESNLSQDKTKNIEITAEINLANEHIDKIADMLVIVGYQSRSTEDLSYYVKTEDSFLFAYEALNTANIKAAKTGVKLQAKNSIIIYAGKLNIAIGSYTIFVGYRLLESDGTIFFNGEQPITFTVE